MERRVNENGTRGLEYLDRAHPGWEGKIVLENLNMNNTLFCLLAQLTATSFTRAVLYLQIGNPAKLGFFVERRVWFLRRLEHREYAMLADFFTKTIIERLGRQKAITELQEEDRKEEELIPC